MRPIDKVILHCSATADYDVGSIPYDYSAADVDVWHRARGWAGGIGYHHFIRRAGLIEQGRAIERVGAHTQGYNARSIGICYAGTAKPTAAQLWSIRELALVINTRFGLTSAQWFGHNDFTKSKTCPGFSIELIRAMLREAGI